MMAQDASDEMLVARARAGSLESWEQLVARHYDRVQRHCWRMLGDVDDAADCVQQTFLNAIINLHKFRNDAQFSSWLLRIATNNCLASFRKGGIKASIVSLDMAEEPSGPVDTAKSIEDTAMIDQIFAELPEDYRIVLILSDREGLAGKEIAEMLGVPVETVYSRLFRARRRFQELYCQALSEQIL